MKVTATYHGVQAKLFASSIDSSDCLRRYATEVFTEDTSIDNMALSSGTTTNIHGCDTHLRISMALRTLATRRRSSISKGCRQAGREQGQKKMKMLQKANVSIRKRASGCASIALFVVCTRGHKPRNNNSLHYIRTVTACLCFSFWSVSARGTISSLWPPSSWVFHSSGIEPSKKT